MPTAGALYLERQEFLYCGQHALNHLLQRREFVSNAIKNPNEGFITSAGKLDLLAYCRAVQEEAAFAFGSLQEARAAIQCSSIGNYHADILVNALQYLGYHVTPFAFDEKGLRQLQQQLPGLLRTGLMQGLLINVKGVHWVAVTSVAAAYRGRHVFIDSQRVHAFRVLTDTQLEPFVASLRPKRVYAVTL